MELETETPVARQCIPRKDASFNTGSGLEFLEDSTLLMKNFTNSVSNSKIFEKSKAANNTTALSQVGAFVKDTPRGILAAGLVIASFIILYLSYTSNLSWTLLITCAFAVVMVVAITLTQIYETKAETKKVLLRNSTALNLEAFSMNNVLSVQSKIEELHNQSIASIINSETQLAAARIHDIAEDEAMHADDIQQRIDVTKRTEQSRYNRTRMKCDVALSASKEVSDSLLEVAGSRASLGNTVVHAEEQMVLEKIRNDETISSYQTKKKLDTKRAESEYQKENARQRADNEINMILRNRRSEIEKEREQLEEYRRQNGV